jgi:CHRD domain
MRKRRTQLVAVVAIVSIVAVVATTAIAGNGRKAEADLDGYQELSPASSISTLGNGEFEARVQSQAIEYELSYEDLEGGAVLFAHIHFGQFHTNGGVSAFLCGGGGKPACPAPPATVTGTIVPTDVVGPAAQGIAAGEFDELVRAMRAGATYANVHTTMFPGGEIRGQIDLGGRDGRDDRDDD